MRTSGRRCHDVDYARKMCRAVDRNCLPVSTRSVISVSARWRPEKVSDIFNKLLPIWRVFCDIYAAGFSRRRSVSNIPDNFTNYDKNYHSVEFCDLLGMSAAVHSL